MDVAKLCHDCSAIRFGQWEIVHGSLLKYNGEIIGALPARCNAQDCVDVLERFAFRQYLQIRKAQEGVK